MASRRRWSDLTERQRGLVIGAAAAEWAAKGVALLDLTRRPQSRLRGPKWLWAAAILVLNTVGPLAYFTAARRPEAATRPADVSS